SVTIGAHELGHLLGLRHGDAYGLIDPSAFLGITPTGERPTHFDLSLAPETADHILQSPASVGTTLFDAAGATYFGEREALKLAFNDGGVAINEQQGLHLSLATAQPLGVLPGLAVPDTLLPGAAHYGKTFQV